MRLNLKINDVNSNIDTIVSPYYVVVEIVRIIFLFKNIKMDIRDKGPQKRSRWILNQKDPQTGKNKCLK